MYPNGWVQPAQDDGPPASHRLATDHPFTVSPSGPSEGSYFIKGNYSSSLSTLTLSVSMTNQTMELQTPYTNAAS